MKPYRSLNKSELAKIARKRGHFDLTGQNKQSLIAMMEAYDRERSLWKGRSNSDLRRKAEAEGIILSRRMNRDKLIGLLMKKWVKGLREQKDNATSLTEQAGPKELLDQVAFERRFYECGFAAGVLNNTHRGNNIWSDVDGRPSDSQLHSMAELYLNATPTQRQQMRDCFDGVNTWPLIKYVRRVAEHIYSRADAGWLRYGLAIASLENARSDYRDLIVSMVVLRFAAERAQIDTAPYFNETIEMSDHSVRPMLENARDHAHSDIRYTVKAFGPSGWVTD